MEEREHRLDMTAGTEAFSYGERSSLLEAAMDANDDAVFVIDGRSRVVYANPVARQVLGGFDPTSSDAVPGLLNLHLLLPDGRPLPAGIDPVASAMAGELVRDLPVRFVTTNGTESHYLLTAQPLFGEAKSVVGALVRLRHSTESANYGPASMGVVESRMRGLVELLDQGFVLFEVLYGETGEPIDLRHLDLNASAERMMGRRREQVIGRTARDLYPDAEPEWLEFFAAVVQAKATAKVLKHYRGQDRWFEVHAIRVGEHTVASIFTDVTERVRTEEDLHESEERLRVVVANSPDIVTIQDHKLRYLALINLPPSADAANYIGKYDADLIPDVERARRVEAQKRQVLHSGVSTTFEFSFPIEEAERWYHVVIEPWRNAAGRIIGIVSYARDITARKRAELALGEAREEAEKTKSYLEAVIDALPAGVTILDDKGGVIRANAMYEQIWRGPRPATRSVDDYAAYKAWWLETGLPVRPEEWASAQAVQKGEAVFGQVFEIERFDGSHAYVLNSGAPVRNPSGELIGSVVAILDISDRITAERALAESEERYRSLFNSMSEGCALHEIVLDEQGVPVDYRFLDINHAFERFTGLRRDDVVGRLKSEVLPGDDPHWLEIYSKVALTGEAVRFDNYSSALNRWYEVFSYRPAPLQFAVIFLEITERKTAEIERERLMIEVEQLARLSAGRAATLNAIIENMADAVFVCEANGVFSLLNRAAREQLGIRENEGVGTTLASYMDRLHLRHPDGNAIPLEETAVARALRGEVLQGFEQVGVHLATGQPINLLLSAAPLTDDEGTVTGAVVVSRDVTELRELDRLKDQFIATAAHELRTPVTIIKGYAQALRRHSGGQIEQANTSQVKMLEAINRGADRMKNLIDDLLEVSHLEHGGMSLARERFDLGELADEVTARFATEHVKHRFRVSQHQGLTVNGDRNRLEQVLVNLLDNAVRYSPEGGNIEVELEALGNEAHVSVRDDGIGIPHDKQGRIFQRFYRAHIDTPYDYGGLGVGLFISQQIVTRHGGRLWFESEEGKGSTFSFSVPL